MWATYYTVQLGIKYLTGYGAKKKKTSYSFQVHSEHPAKVFKQVWSSFETSKEERKKGVDDEEAKRKTKKLICDVDFLCNFSVIPNTREDLYRL